MTGSYSLGMVCLSVLVAMLASYTALDLAQRISKIQVPRYRHFWLIGGAVAMGVGIWAMHFVGMLALSLPFELGYDMWTTLLSLGIAVIVSWFALHTATCRRVRLRRVLIGGVLMGFGISAMHYTGMAALLIRPHVTHNPWLVIASVVIAISASVVALLIAFSLRDDAKSSPLLLKKIAAAAVMGSAISGMHYTGMAAIDFAPDSMSLATQVNSTWLTIAIVAISLSVLIIALILSVLDAQLELQSSTFTQSLKTANDQLRHLATHDALTDLPNRLTLAERIHDAMEASRHSGRPFAVIYIDLDGFKMINDTLGHQVGDALLKAVAARILAVVRKQDTLTRVGGDEFVLLIEDVAEPQHVIALCEQVRTALLAPLQAGAAALHVTASIGIALFPTDGESVEALLHNADAAMYEVKRGGRNGCRHFEPTMNTTTLRTLRIQAELRRALHENELSLVYQPKFTGPSLTLNGAEALLRWQHAEMGAISPAEFIPIAERSGLILELGEWVIREACRQQLRWREDGVQPLKIAVNLSAKHLRQHNLAQHLCEILQEYHLDPALLMLEITESVMMDDAKDNVAMVTQLKQAGFEIAIDDFGTGYSSLSYLQKFRVSQIKIDRFFIDGLDKNHAEGVAIVSAIIALAGSLHLDVVAEGVETHTQLQLLKRLGCNQYQGFLLGEPMPAHKFTAILDLRRAM